MATVLIILFILLITFSIMMGRRYVKHLQMQKDVIDKPYFYPHRSFLLGVFYDIMTFGNAGHKGVDGIRISARISFFHPYSEIGFHIGWAGFLFPIWFVVPSRTEILKAILASKKRVDKGKIYQIIDLFHGGLISSERMKWAKHRKILNPTFHQSMLQQFVPILCQQAHKLISILDEKTANGPAVITDFTENVSERIMAMLMETIMGTKEENLDPEFRLATERADKRQVSRLQNPWKFIKFLYVLTSEGRRYHKDVAFVNTEARRLVNLRILDLKNDDMGIKTDGKSFLIDALIMEHIKNPEDVSIEDIVSEVLTFLIAGWDTTTWTTTFFLQHVGGNIRIQDKIHEEIDSELDGVTDDHLLTTADISKLKYLECVINETLRYSPLVLAHLRHLYEDLEVEIDGVKRVIPSGSDVLIDHELFHHSPRYWTDPDRFIPERFLPENSENRDPLAFIPFSYGPRNCIGRTFAMNEEKVILAQIFRKFKVTAVDPLDKLDMDLTGIARRTKTPVKFLFEPRQAK